MMQLPLTAQFPARFSLTALLCCACLILAPLPAMAEVEELQKRANAGDAAASHDLAERYLQGEGVEQDDEQAAYWYRRAAEQGHYGPGEEGTPADPPRPGQRIVSPPLEPVVDTGSDSDPRPAEPVTDEPAATTGIAVPDEPEVQQQTDPDDAHELATNGITDQVRDSAADEARVAAARQVVEAGDYQQALQMLYPEAVQENPAAQTLLGDLYMQGLGVEQSHERAMLWYRRAARLDDARAQFNLGNLYLMGEGVLQDDDTAEAWFELAAAQGHDGARNNLANLKRRRETRISPLATRPPPPIMEIQEEVLTAIETESEPAAHTDAATGAGDGDATVAAPAAVPVAPGRVVTPPIHTLDPIEPIAEVAVVDEQPEAIAVPDTPADDADAVETVAVPEPAVSAATEAQQQASPGDPDARALYEQGQQLALGDGSRRDPAAAIDYYRRAAELGYAPAQYRLGAAYHYGEGIDKNPAQAVVWYRRAAEQGFTMAQRNLGNLYLRGEGVAQDKVQALAWLSLVAVRGSEIDRQQHEQLAGTLSDEELERARELAAEYSKL